MKHHVIITSATLSDIEGILEVEQMSFGIESFTRKQFVYLISKAKGMFYVAKHEEKIVGYLSLITNSFIRYARIYSIAVHPDTRGMKIGQLLLDKGLEYAREQNFKSVTLEVNVNNNGAIQLYLKNGFTIKGTKRFYYPDGANAFSMHKPLL